MATGKEVLPAHSFSEMWKKTETIYPKLENVLDANEIQFIAQCIGIAMGVVHERSAKG